MLRQWTRRFRVCLHLAASGGAPLRSEVRCMKKPAVIITVVVTVLIAAAWMPAARFIAWRHDYAEAEPLVQLVWPMAGEMKRFSTDTGRPPASLEELDHFSKDYDFSPLAVYHPKFTPGGKVLFHLDANSRFSFEIDESFIPKWARFTGVLEKPKQSSVGYAPNRVAGRGALPASTPPDMRAASGGSGQIEEAGSDGRSWPPQCRRTHCFFRPAKPLAPRYWAAGFSLPRRRR